VADPGSQTMGGGLRHNFGSVFVGLHVVLGSPAPPFTAADAIHGNLLPERLSMAIPLNLTILGLW
jgi:hypothetical protein